MLVDSDVLIWYLRGRPKAAQFLDALPALQLSSVSYIELVQGMRNKRELETLKADLDQRRATILPITEAISAHAVTLVENHFHSHALQLADRSSRQRPSSMACRSRRLTISTIG